MASITFKVKPVAKLNADGSETGAHILYFPKLDRKHCDMDAFRSHPKHGSLANSTLFPSVLARISKSFAPYGHIVTDALPDGVTIDRSGFLWNVTLAV